MEQLQERLKIALYLDWGLRIPNFLNCYENLRTTVLFNTDEINADVTIKKKNIEIDKRNFWRRELEKPGIIEFYGSKNLESINDKEISDEIIKSYFFNDEHYKMFLSEYSFDLYGKADPINRSLVNVVNITQAKLFDVTIIDRYVDSRKQTNSFFWLGTTGLFIKGMVFLNALDVLDDSRYIGIWNPQINKEQTDLLEWIKALEEEHRIKPLLAEQEKEKV